jgi:hypothetical protein
MRSSMQSIFRHHFAQLAQTRTLSLRELAAASAIMKCGTPAMGGHVLECPQGHYQRVQYHSCRHRSCPRCAEQPRQQWVQGVLGRLLPCEHFHAVFTLPHEFIALWEYNRELLSKELFDAVRRSVLQLCADPRLLGAQPGVLMALHTWGRTLSRHPHVHCLISAGGLDAQGNWKSSRREHLVPVKALAALFRGKLLARLSELLKSGRLKLPEQQPLEYWRACISRQYRAHWNVQLAQRYAHGRGVALYLARYVKGGALPSSRPLFENDHQVSFGYTDHRDGRAKTLSLSPQHFLQRVLWHAPPRGQHMVRYCGLYATGAAHEHARARAAQRLHTPLDTSARPVLQCPQCQRPLVRTLSLLPVHQDGENSNALPITVEQLGPTPSSSRRPTAGDSSLRHRWRRRAQLN